MRLPCICRTWAASLGAVAALAHAADPGVAETLEQVVVTGTRAEGRLWHGSPTPIDVVDGDSLQALGFPDTARALQFLEPSVNFARAATTATAANSRPITLRGLAPDQTLVLVNGKRRHASSILNTNNAVGRGSAPIDLDAIPPAAIERIEILRDGAAAQYGSDAIAGVINIILKRNGTERTVALAGGMTEEGDGEYIATSAYTGFGLPGDGGLSLSVELRKQERTNRANVDQRLGRVTYWFGDPETELAGAAANLHVPAYGGELYAFGTLSRKDSTNPGGFRLPGRTPLFPNGYLPKINPLISDGAITAGWEKTLDNRWRVDLSHTFGRSKAEFEVYDTVNQSLGVASPTHFDAGATTYSQHVTDLKLSLPLDDVLTGGNFALGAQYRRENYDITASEEAAFVGLGADGFAGFNPRTPIDASRSAQAMFVELELRPLKRILLSAAARYDDYDDFGGAGTWKVASRVELTDALALRGAVGTGFRAPSLQQQHFSAVAGALSAGILVSVGTLPVADPVAQSLGARELKPEESDNYSAGIVWTPTSSIAVALDWFRIDIADRIALSEQLAGAAVTSTLRNAGVTNVDQVRFFTNALDTKTAGLEATARYRAQVGAYGVALAAGYGRFDSELATLRGNEVLPSLPLLNTKSILYVTEAQPKDKATFAAELSRGRWAAQTNITYFGHYTSQPIVLTQTFGSHTLFDVSARVQIGSMFSVALGVQNVGDSQPDALIGQQAVIAATGNSFPTGEEAPFGVNGRSYFLRADARF